MFVTLTYCDDALPEKGSLVREDVKKYCKRLRKYMLTHHNRKIKYMAVGEYGENGTERPHYHLIILGMRYERWREPIKTTAHTTVKDNKQITWFEKYKWVEGRDHKIAEQMWRNARCKKTKRIGKRPPRRNEKTRR